MFIMSFTTLNIYNLHINFYIQFKNCSKLVIFIDFKKAYISFKREVLLKILTEFGIPKKLLTLIKMRLSKTYSRV